MKVKLRGVYDLELFRYLKKIGVKHFAFDLRPTSFNFTPVRKIVEMLESAGGPEDRYYFMFGTDKDFVIEQLVGYIRKKVSLGQENCFLEFTDARDLAACSKFGIPFVWRYMETVDYRKLSSVEHLSGISLSYQYLEELRDSNQLYPFILEFNQLMRDDQWIDLTLDWSDHLSESVIDFLPAKTYSYEINPKVEDSYRHINMGLVSSHLEHAKRILNLEP